MPKLLIIFLFSITLFSKDVFAWQVSKKNTYKKELLKIYQDHQFTFFCHLPFSMDGKIAYQGCTACPTVNLLIQWMPIVSLKRLAEDKLCYQEKICIDSHGKRFKGLRCCQEVNPIYQRMSQDLHNLVPEHPALIKMRHNFDFGIFTQGDQPMSDCHFYVDKKLKRLEPSCHTRGSIARAFLYMRDTYHLHLSIEETEQYLNWHHAYPVTNWEYERNDRIRKIQGNGNRYVETNFSLS